MLLVSPWTHYHVSALILVATTQLPSVAAYFNAEERLGTLCRVAQPKGKGL